MKYKAIMVLFLLVIICTGCSLKRSEEKSEEEKNQIEYVNSIDNLTPGNYYIYHEDKYLKPYIGYASFDTTKSTNTSDTRVAWFMDDWSKIPTLYSGDYLVYYTDNPLDESFKVERFEYLGYTIGICNMKRMSSGRYAFYATKDEKSGSSYINPGSDAARLLSLNTEQAIIDNIGTAKLRAGNITRAGTVQGLEPEASYATDIYIGSELKTYILKADSIALCSMDYFDTNDYTFLRSKVLRINFPDYMNDGYYSVNGSGIFRYVKGFSYTENTDFNVPNEKTGEIEENTEQQDINEDTNAVTRESFTLNKEGKTTIVITYGENMGEEYQIADPTAKLIGEATVYTFTNDDVGELKLTADLKPGVYRIEITGLYGRTFKYDVYQKKESSE